MVPADDRVWIAKTSEALLDIPGRQIEIEHPEELSNAELVYEGVKHAIVVNRYERDRAARLLCIQKWGYSCSVCNENMEQKYGELGRGYIHVHHLNPLGEIGEGYHLDPINDLRPVCPNCHAMLHRRTPALSICELAGMLRR